MTYEAPLIDSLFNLTHVARLETLASDCAMEDVDLELVASILPEAAKFAQDIMAPLNRTGDTIGAKFDSGKVSLPKGWKEAYEAWCTAGWCSLGCEEAYGGQNLPQTIGTSVGEYWASANMSFGLGPLLTMGAIDALSQHASDALKQIYLPKMIAGKWTGTMNLTEPQAGSDLGALQTKATPNGDGTYAIKGTKIFISYGEHELTENIIHLVLARLPDAPKGTKGISLFLVPKFLVNEDGSLGERNDLVASGLEHKLGIHGSPTCTMSFGDNDGAIGYLVGEENRGLNAMFTMMNRARLGVGNQGVGLAQRALQQAQAYANERKQGRTPATPKNESTPIIHHPDIARMLLRSKALVTAGRTLCTQTAKHMDLSERATDPSQRKQSELRAALYTPLAKAFSTDMCNEVTSLAIQIHGGMGYIEETGAAQYYRDARILAIYEGTNGIQALDLVYRKLPLEGGKLMENCLKEFYEICAKAARSQFEPLHTIAPFLKSALDDLREATIWMGQQLVHKDQDQTACQAVANHYLKLVSLCFAGSFMLEGALNGFEAKDEYAPHYGAIVTFFAADLLPETKTLKHQIFQGGEALIKATPLLFI